MRLLFFLFLTGFIASCRQGEQNTNTPKEKLGHEARFTTFTIENYRAVVIKCDQGRLELTVRQYEIPKMEIHKTYQKYVKLEPRNDTLFIYTEGTPKNAEQVKIRKSINLYLPDLAYLESDISQITVFDYDSPEMKILNRSNALRLYNCRIRDMAIDNTGLCNVYLDSNNYFENLSVSLNEDSHYNSHANVLNLFTLKAKNLDKANFTHLPQNGFRWIKD